jgi:hypothetical protein
VRARFFAKLPRCRRQRSWPAHIHVAMQHQATLCVPKVALETARFTLHTSDSTLHTSSHLIWTLLISSKLFSSLLIYHLS